jgi:hypothetical protein
MKTTSMPLKHKCSVKTGFCKLDQSQSTIVKHKNLYYASIMIKQLRKETAAGQKGCHG